MKPKNETEDEFTIRIPLKMLQVTEQDGKTWPVAFYWPNADGVDEQVSTDRVVGVSPLAEQKSGTVGDRYECEINGLTEYIYYTKLTPRKWFKIVPVSEQEYKNYYKLPGENRG